MNRGEITDRIWDAYDAGTIIPACAWCERLRIDDEWLELDRGVLAMIDARMTLSHSLCPRCAETQLAPKGAGGHRSDQPS